MTTKSFGDNGDKFVSDLEYLGTDNMRSLKSIKSILTKMQEKIVKIDSQYTTIDFEKNGTPTKQFNAMYTDYVANKTNLIQYVRKNLCFCVSLPKNWTKCSLFLELFFFFLCWQLYWESSILT